MRGVFFSYQEKRGLGMEQKLLSVFFSGGLSDGPAVLYLPYYGAVSRL